MVEVVRKITTASSSARRKPRNKQEHQRGMRALAPLMVAAFQSRGTTLARWADMQSCRSSSNEVGIKAQGNGRSWRSCTRLDPSSSGPSDSRGRR